MNTQLDSYYQQMVLRGGPAKVVIDDEGSAKPPSKARKLGISPDIIFIRGDGWTLGAPYRFEGVAFRMWREEWIGFVEKGDENPTPICDYDHLIGAVMSAEELMRTPLPEEES